MRTKATITEHLEKRKARVEAEVKNKRLRATIDAMSAKIDTLVAMVSDLRKEAGMDALSEDEKDELRETPDFTSDDTSHDSTGPNDTQ